VVLEQAKAFAREERDRLAPPRTFEGAPMTLEQDRERKRIAFTQEVVPLIAKYLGEDPSLNDYEALVVALQEMSEELAMIENNLATLADMRGLADDDIYALTKRAIEAAG
jgi:hypothetical protein